MITSTIIKEPIDWADESILIYHEIIRHTLNTLENIIIPQLKEVNNTLIYLSTIWSDVYMISKTHGQCAVTTSMGKELKVFNSRLSIQILKLEEIKYTSKFGGAVGNLNAHYFCFECIDWDEIMDNFLLGEFEITRNKYTTQIDHYDNYAEIFDILRRINVIFILRFA